MLENRETEKTDKPAGEAIVMLDSSEEGNTDLFLEALLKAAQGILIRRQAVVHSDKQAA